MNSLALQNKSISDFTFEELMEEAGRKLRESFENKFRNKFLFGHFKFVFNHGRLVGIEGWPRQRMYYDPGVKNKNRKHQ